MYIYIYIYIYICVSVSHVYLPIVNVNPTHPISSCATVHMDGCYMSPLPTCIFPVYQDQQVTHTQTDREQHPRHRHTTRTTPQTPKRTVNVNPNTSKL